MKVKCHSAKGRALPSDHRGLYFTESTVFHVTPGQSYPVHEMALFNSGLIFLVIDDDGQPNWYPAELFEVEDPRLPADWLFALRAGEERGTQAVWGHPRLVTDPDLDDALADHDPDATAVFWREVATPGERDGDGGGTAGP